MPALPLVAAHLKVELGFLDGNDSTILARQFYRYSGAAPSNANALTLATAIKSNGDAQFPGLLSSGCQFTSCSVEDLSSASGGYGQFVAVAGGTRAGEPLPVGTPTLVGYTIGRRYRGGKPRNYFPFGVGADLGNGSVWLTAYVTAVHTAMAAFLAANIGETAGTTVIAAQANISYYEGFTPVENIITGRWKNVAKPRAVPLVDDVLTIVVPDKPGSQRRRYQR